MIRLKVNGVERSFDGGPEMPVLWYLGHIERLVAEEHRLTTKGATTEADRARSAKIQVALDQCWDLLRQRRALRKFGRDAKEAHVRPPEVVEHYEG